MIYSTIHTRNTKFCLMAMMWLLLGFLSIQSIQAQEDVVQVLQVDIHGAISPVQVDLLESALGHVRDSGFSLLLMRLDTPGGLVDSTRDMIQLMRNAPVPIIVWVGPTGARAASAGVFIVAASHMAGMDTKSTIGAASPVGMGGKDIPETMARKVENDILSLLRSMLEGTDRNVEWYEQAVKESVSVTAMEAVQKKVVEFVADSPEDLLIQAGKRGIPFHGKPLQFSPDSIQIVKHEPGFRHSFLSWLLDPQVAYLLLLGGMAGIFFELTNPGAILPGVVGGLGLLLGLYAMSVLPTNVAGLLLLLFGLVLFLLEIKVTSYGLLSVAALGSLFIGSLILFKRVPGMEPLPITTILVTVAGVGALLGLAVYLVSKAQLARPKLSSDNLEGEIGEIRSWSQDKGRIFIHGESWMAEAEDNVPFQPGDKVQVRRKNGLTLVVSRVNTVITD